LNGSLIDLSINLLCSSASTLASATGWSTARIVVIPRFAAIG
jgi:hypothetical protein